MSSYQVVEVLTVGITLGPNYRGQLLPNHPPHRLCWSTCRKAIHHRIYISRGFCSVVAPL